MNQRDIQRIANTLQRADSLPHHAVVRPVTLSPEMVRVTPLRSPTNKKYYAPNIGGRLLRLSFPKRDIALQYGRAVIDRYRVLSYHKQMADADKLLKEQSK